MQYNVICRFTIDMETFITLYIAQIFFLFVIIIFGFCNDTEITVGDLMLAVLIMIIPIVGLIIQIIFIIKVSD
mgnify:CR=1 FL=1